MASTAVAYDIIARDRASKAFRDVSNSATASQKRIDKVNKAIKTASVAVAGAAVAGAAVFVKQSISLEAEFGRTMNLFQANTGATAKQMQQMSALAIKMGRDTVFSASDAANAMLELGKNGIRPATIQAGALKSALTLAAAGGVDMEQAATVMGNALNAFALKGTDASKVAAALAGGANASSASVQSLAYGLSAAGASAHASGLSIQETVAALSAFENAGIKGQDAGTSLKTFLTRLIPTTKSASLAMSHLGLFSKKTGSVFVDQHGNFKSLTQISGELQKHLGKLSEAERTSALQMIFGSDAQRAANILTNEGAKGIRSYIKATSDQGAAQKMANASMKGTAGSIEQLKGSLETVELQFGRMAAPYVRQALNSLTNVLNNFGKNVLPKVGHELGVVFGWLGKNKAVVATFAATIGLAVAGFKVYTAVTKVAAIVTAAQAVAAGTATEAQLALNAAMKANLIGLAVTAIAALAAGLVYAYKHSETFRKVCQDAFHAVATAGKWMWNTILQPVFHLLVDAIGHVMLGWSKLLGALSHVPGFGWAKKAADLMQGAGEKALQLADHINKIPNHKNITVDVTANYSNHAKQIMRQQGLTGSGYVPAGNLTAGKRALGGPVRAGVPYTVGENGSETFVPSQPGRILRHGQTPGKTVNIHIDKLMPANYDEFAREIDQRQRTAALGALG